MSEWVQHAFWWHIYPLGFVGAFPAKCRPWQRTPIAPCHRMARPRGDAGPVPYRTRTVFASRTHGYDTTDHYRIDPRLGDDTDFDDLVAQHENWLRVLLDGVFNHVGTDFANTAPHSTAMLRPQWFVGKPADSGRLKVTMT